MTQCTVLTEMPSSARRTMQTILTLHRVQSFQVLHCVSTIIASVSRCLSACLSICLSVSIRPSNHPSIQPYFNLSIKPPTYQSLYGSLTISNLIATHAFIRYSLFLRVCLCIYLFVNLFHPSCLSISNPLTQPNSFETTHPAIYALIRLLSLMSVLSSCRPGSPVSSVFLYFPFCLSCLLYSSLY